jgi:hypothetical protein
MNETDLLAIIAQAEREGWEELDLSGNDLEGLPTNHANTRCDLRISKYDASFPRLQPNHTDTR